MDGVDSIRTILARIPDLSGEMGGRAPEHGKCAAASRGRWIDQSLAFKLLSGVALSLFVVAVLPLFSGRKERNSDASSTSEAMAPWRQESSAMAPGTRVAQSRPRPVTRVQAVPERSSVSSAPPGRPKVKDVPKAEADEPLMSAWPRPPRPDDQTASRPPEYQADTRAADGLK